MIKVGDIVVPIDTPPKRLSMRDPFHWGFEMTVKKIYKDGGCRMVELFLRDVKNPGFHSNLHGFSSWLNVNIDFVKKSLTKPGK